MLPSKDKSKHKKKGKSATKSQQNKSPQAPSRQEKEYNKVRKLLLSEADDEQYNMSIALEKCQDPPNKIASNIQPEESKVEETFNPTTQFEQRLFLALNSQFTAMNDKIELNQQRFHENIITSIQTEVEKEMEVETENMKTKLATYISQEVAEIKEAD